MIYLDEKIASHRKILRAGRLIGDAHGGAMAALGLYVAAIGYARSYLTDGEVPDEFLQKASRNSDAIASLRKAKLIRKLRGNRWLVHDYLDWNKSAEEVKRDQQLGRRRQQDFRRKSTCGKPVRNGVTSPPGERRSNAIVTQDPLSPIPDPRSPIPSTEVQDTASAVPSVSDPDLVPRVQRPNGRETHLAGVGLTAERRQTLAHAPADDANYAVLVRLVHAVMDATGQTDPTSPDLVEAVKVAAATKAIAYPPDVLTRALESAGAQRAVHAVTMGPLGDLASAVQTALRAGVLPQTLRTLQQTRRARVR